MTVTPGAVRRFGSERIRIGPWRGDRRVAYLALVPGTDSVGEDTIRRCLAELAAQGYREAVTAALGPHEAHAFLRNGFTVRERLHLLARELAVPDANAMPGPAIRRARRADRPAVLAVDGAAFDDFWRLDEPGLDEALAATPSTRFRVSVSDEDGARITGYTVTGRSGGRGFLQRLAVDPACHRRGIGLALVTDALDWLRRRGAERVVVNTQEHNAAALALYERAGFRRQSTGLAVLRSTLE